MPFDHTSPAHHLEAVAHLILERPTWTPSPEDKLVLVELARGFRIDILGSENGKPVRRKSYHETTRELAIQLVASLALVSGFPFAAVGRQRS